MVQAKHPIRRRLFVIALIALIVLTLAELAASHYVAGANATWIRPSADPILGWEQVPNVVLQYTGHTRKLSECPCPVVFNEFGFRDAHHQTPKPVGVFRIVGLGCTEMVGLGVDSEHTKLEELRSILLDLTSEPRIETINMGVDGYNFIQNIENLRTKGMRYNPDLVINNFTWYNTIAPMNVGALVDNGAVHNWLFNHIRLYKLAFFMIHYRQVMQPPLSPEAMSQALRNLDELAGSARFSVAHVYMGPNDIESIRGVLLESRSLGHEVVEIDLSNWEDALFDSRHEHLGALGNRRWAQIVGCDLVRRQLVPARPNEAALAALCR